MIVRANKVIFHTHLLIRYFVVAENSFYQKGNYTFISLFIKEDIVSALDYLRSIGWDNFNRMDNTVCIWQVGSILPLVCQIHNRVDIVIFYCPDL